MLGNAGEMDEVKMWNFAEKPLHDKLHKVLLLVPKLHSASGQVVFLSTINCTKVDTAYTMGQQEETKLISLLGYDPG